MIQTPNLGLEKYELTDAANLADGYNSSMDTLDKFASDTNAHFPIKTNDIADNAITNAKLNNGAVTTDKIVDANITTSKLANASVTADKLTSEAVIKNIDNNSITNTMLADDSVTANKIPDGEIVNRHLNTPCVNNDNIFDNSITFSKLAKTTIENISNFIDVYVNPTDTQKTISEYISNPYIHSIYFNAGDYNFSADSTTHHVFAPSSNKNIFFDKKANINLLPNSFDGYNLFYIKNVSNITIVGGKFIGDKNTHTGTTGEWGNCIDIRESNNIKIIGANINNFWGDGIEIANYNANLTTQEYMGNIIISNCYIHDNGRNNVSVIAGENLIIEYCIFSNANRTAPKADIDFEPNSYDTAITTAFVHNNIFYESPGANILMYNSINGSRIDIQNNSFYSNVNNITISIKEPMPITINNNIFNTYKANSIIINSFSTSEITITNNIFKPDIVPIFIANINSTNGINLKYINNRATHHESFSNNDTFSKDAIMDLRFSNLYWARDLGGCTILPSEFIVNYPPNNETFMYIYKYIFTKGGSIKFRHSNFGNITRYSRILVIGSALTITCEGNNNTISETCAAGTLAYVKYDAADFTIEKIPING